MTSTKTKTHTGPCRGKCGCTYGTVSNPSLMAEMAVRHAAVADAMETLIHALRASAELAPDYTSALVASERFVADRIGKALTAAASN